MPKLNQPLPVRIYDSEESIGITLDVTVLQKSTFHVKKPNVHFFNSQ
jgi:hypothetical protein